MNAKKSVSDNKKKSKAKTAAAEPKTSAAKSVTSAKDLLSKQSGDVPDLNSGTGYPVHPDRIWPD